MTGSAKDVVAAIGGKGRREKEREGEVGRKDRAPAERLSHAGVAEQDQK